MASRDQLETPKPSSDTCTQLSTSKISPLLKLPDEILLLILDLVAPSTEAWSTRRLALLPLRLLHPLLLPLIDDTIFGQIKLDIPLFSGPLQHFSALCRSKRISNRTRTLHLVDHAVSVPYPLWVPDLPVAFFLSKVEAHGRKVDLVDNILTNCEHLKSLTIEVAHAATPLLSSTLSNVSRFVLCNQAICWDIQQLLHFTPNCSDLVLDGVWAFNHSLKADVSPVQRERKKLSTMTIRNIDASVVSRLLERSHVCPEELAVEVNGSAIPLAEALTQDGLVRQMRVLRLSVGRRVSKSDMERLELELRSRLAGRGILLLTEQAECMTI